MLSEFQDTQNKQNMLAHGISVYFSFKNIIEYLSGNGHLDAPLPNWITTHKEKLLNKILPAYDSIKTYLIYHDCGKPKSLIIDSNGKRHFPNHAEISQELFSLYSKDELARYLIGQDMVCHISKPKDATALKTTPHIEILLCTALAALISNAKMFGGFESDSFKIKFKSLSKLGNNILT